MKLTKTGKTIKKDNKNKKDITDTLKVVEGILTNKTDGFSISIKKATKEGKHHQALVKVTNVNREFILLGVLEAIDVDIDDLVHFTVSRIVR